MLTDKTLREIYEILVSEPSRETAAKAIGSVLNQATLVHEETKKRLHELTILYEMTKISNSSFNRDQMLKEMMKSLQHSFDVDCVRISLIDEGTKRVFLHPPVTEGDAIELEDWEKVHVEPFFANNVKREGGHVASQMCAPLKVKEKIIGTIGVESRKAQGYSEDILRLFARIAEHLATIIENVRSEERHRAVVENALDGVMVTDGELQFTYVNERLARLLGCSREELIGRNFRDHLDEESRRRVVGKEVRRHQGEEVPGHDELKVVRKDGEVRSVETSSAVIKDPEGNVSIVVFVKDITEKRKMEERLFQAEKLRAVGEMASGVAHDFNNALAIILGSVQILLSQDHDRDVTDLLRMIEKVAKDSAYKIRRLNEFTRSRVREEELFDLDINAIVRDAVAMTRPKWNDEAESKGIQINVVTSLEEIPPLAGDVSELREVILSMILNAVEAMPEGGRIEIRTSRGKDRVCIQISDTGKGMTEEVRKKIFEPFFTTKPFSNPGLGLSMCYGIIRRYGGEIEVESQPGKGSLFMISLPSGSVSEKEKKVPPC
jgi:PAS domain S-box-containing protein